MYCSDDHRPCRLQPVDRYGANKWRCLFIHPYPKLKRVDLYVLTWIWPPWWDTCGLGSETKHQPSWTGIHVVVAYVIVHFLQGLGRVLLGYLACLWPVQNDKHQYTKTWYLIATLVPILQYSYLCVNYLPRDSPTVWYLSAFSPILSQFYVPFYVKKKKKMDNFMCLLEFECAKRLKAHRLSLLVPTLISLLLFFREHVHEKCAHETEDEAQGRCCSGPRLRWTERQM